jgi:hypothetical protein
MHSRNPGQAASSRLAGPRAVRGAILVVLFSLLTLQETTAHDPGLSSLTICPSPNGLEATLTLAGRDAAQLAELDDDRDGRVTKAEFAHGRSQLEAAVAAQLIVATDGKLAKPASIGSRLDQNTNVEIHLGFPVSVFSSLEIQSKVIASLPLGHREYLQVQNSAGETVFNRLLNAAADRAAVQMPHTNRSNSAFESVRSFANFLSLWPIGRGAGLFLRIKYHHFIYDRALDHAGAGDGALRANSKSNCGAIDRCFHRLCRRRESFARRDSEIAAAGHVRLRLDPRLRLCFGLA